MQDVAGHDVTTGVFCMPPLTRRGAIRLVSSLLATTPFLIRQGRAESAPNQGSVVFNMTSFAGAGVDADAAFAKAIAAVEKAAADASKGGGPVHIVFNLQQGATYRIKRPLPFKQLAGFELNGNGAQLINTARGQTLHITN
jgi:hypothetical protein